MIGKVQAVILDWSGTTADAYVVAPAVVFVDVFKRQNVEISMAEAEAGAASICRISRRSTSSDVFWLPENEIRLT